VRVNPATRVRPLGWRSIITGRSDVAGVQRTMQQLFERVYMLEGEVGGRPLQLTYLRGDRLDLLIDTGCAGDPDQFVADQIRQAGGFPASVRLIVNTHSDLDHTGGNAAMKRLAPGALLMCGTADRAACFDPHVLFSSRYDAYRHSHGIFYDDAAAGWIREQSGYATPIDVTSNGGTFLQLSDDWAVELIALPGHSHGHLGVYDRHNHALYGGDAIHGAVYPGLDGSPKLCPTYLHVDDYLQTIDRIRALPISTYVGCHWPVMRGDAVAAFCAESRAFVERADALLMKLFQRGTPVTLREACLQLGPQLGEWPDVPALHLELIFALNGHAERLVQQGKVETQRVDGVLAYQAVM